MWRSDDAGEDNIEPDLEDTIHILNDTDLEKFSLKYPPSWKRIRFVQTCLKAPTGIGQLLICHFYAPLKDLHQKIKYDFRAAGDDLDLIQRDQM
jgi:hypothetical protein